MTASVYDFAEIAKEARLRALEGFNQNEEKPVEMPSDSNPQAADAEYFYGVGFTAPEQDGA